MTKTKITVLRHSIGTPPGSVSDWANARGHDLDVRELHRGASLPSLGPTLGTAGAREPNEMLVILGGPMNVDDVADYPWLKDEKAFIERAVASGIPCLGLCLGGQLLSQILGGRVHKHDHWEAGWHDVRLEPKGPLVSDVDRLRVFQWHQDTFTIPSGAQRVATNDITPNQGFVYGKNVIGLQFHPEATNTWVTERAEEKNYPEGPFVQESKVVLEGVRNLPRMREWFFDLLDGFTKNGHSR